MNSAGFQLCYGCWSLIWYMAIIKNVINSWSYTDVISHRAHNDPCCSYTKAFWQIRWLPGKGYFYLSFKYVKWFLMGSWPIGWFHVKIQEKATTKASLVSTFQGPGEQGLWEQSLWEQGLGTGSLGTESRNRVSGVQQGWKGNIKISPLRTVVKFGIFSKYLLLTPV